MCNKCNPCGCPEGVRLYATNVMYQTELPEWSYLKDEKCVVTEDTTTELYNEIDKLRSDITKDELCDKVDYVVDDDGIVSYREGVLKNSLAICELFSEITNSYEETLVQDLSCLDWKTLKVEDNCGQEIVPKNLCEALQRIIDKIA